MTPDGIETATLRFVAQHLNHCATAVPQALVSTIYSSSCLVFFAKLRIANISFVISARLSVRMELLDSHWTGFMKFDI